MNKYKNMVKKGMIGIKGEFFFSDLFRFKGIKRSIAFIICMVMAISSFGVPAFAINGEPSKPQDGVTASAKDMTADPNTMYSYDMIDESQKDDANGSRYAGRIWSDKSVIAYNDPQLSEADEKGYKKFVFGKTKLNAYGKKDDGNYVKTNEDFLHIFSALGSSVQYTGKVPTSTVIVIDNSGSMYTNNKTDWTKTRMSITVDAVNKAIDRLMRENEDNWVSVVLFGDGDSSKKSDGTVIGTNTAHEIIPLGHYPVGGGYFST